LNKWLPAIAFSVILLVPLGIQDAFAGPNTAPNITGINAVNPDGGSTLRTGEDFILSATTTDTEDGPNSGSFEWVVTDSDNIVVSAPPTNTRIVVIGLAPGTYDVQVTVTDSGGLTDTDSTTITVEENPEKKGCNVWRYRSCRN